MTKHIYGVDVKIPELKDGEYIEDWGYPDTPSMQFWRRIELPSFFSKVDFDSDGNALLSYEQREYAQEQVRRCKIGFTFYNNGTPVYIPGKYYFYLNFWKLEDDVYPDFRMADRDYFLFLDHWEKVSWCLGLIRGKRRRLGATSQAASNLIYECIFYKNSICGLTSKSQIDAKSAFTNMVAFGYRQLPVFLKPKQLNNKDSVTELVFRNKSMTVKNGMGSVIDTDTGHRSKLDYRSPTLNAYDSGRCSRLLIDEGGKFPKEVPFSTFISIVSKTLVQGIKRVGFMECPSTTNAMTSGGGEFKNVWDAADHVKNERTPNRLVRYMTPAYDGYLGFIDKYGNSVIDPPNEEQYKYLVENFVGIGDLTEEDVKLGARQYLINKRKQLEGSLLEEEIRMNPFDENEMFKSAIGGGHFDNIFLGELYTSASVMEKEVLEYGIFSWENNEPFTKAIWHTTSKEAGRWVKPKDFKFPENETVKWVGNHAKPQNVIQFISACDPFQNDIVESGKGSLASSAVLNRAENGTNDEIYDKMFVLKYLYRPATAAMFHMDMALQCFAFGCRLLPEAKMDGGLRKFFIDNWLEPFLIRLPDKSNYGIDPNEDNKTIMINIWEQYILTEGRKGKLIYPSLIDQLMRFDRHNTEKFDEVMGCGWTLVADYYNKANFRKKTDSIDITHYFKRTA